MMDLLLNFVKTGYLLQFFEFFNNFDFCRKPKILDLDWQPVQFPEISFAKITNFEPEDVTIETSNELAPREFWKSLGFLENQNLVLIKDEL